MAIAGLGLGGYLGVDLALATDALPNKEKDAAKDLGLFNIASALPQIRCAGAGCTDSRLSTEDGAIRRCSPPRVMVAVFSAAAIAAGEDECPLKTECEAAGWRLAAHPADPHQLNFTLSRARSLN